MGRPSNKSQRIEEILEAFYRCVARYGLEGSTLERVAEESGLKRSLVRHHAGNRENLEAMLIDRVLQQSHQQWRDLIDSVPVENSSVWLVDSLFGDQYSDAEYILVIESLIFSAGRDAELRQRMQTWMQGFTDDLTMILSQEYLHAERQAVEAVSFGLISLYFNLDSLAPLGMNQQYRQPARQAAQYLLSSLSKN